jgi:acyl-CoA dehydrogenase
VLELRNRLIKFMEDRIYPMENEFYKLAQSTSRWTVHQEEEKLKELATKEGLWNLWIPVCILIFLSIYTFYVYFFFLEA